MLSKRYWFLLLTVVLTLGLLVACSQPKTTPAPAPAPAASPSPKPSPTVAPAPAASPAPKPSPTVAAKPAGKIPVLMAGPPTGWVAYAAAVAAADIANRNSNLNITVSSFAGSNPVIDALLSKKADLAVGPAEYNWGPLFNAEQDFAGKPPIKNVRAVLAYMRLYSSIQTPARTGIKTAADLKGKKVAWHTASPMATAEALIAANGLDPAKDITKVLVPGAPQSIQEIVMGRAEARWGTIEASAVNLQLFDAVGPLRALPWEPAKFDWMKQNRLSAIRGTVIVKIEPGWQKILDIPAGGQYVAANTWTVGTRDDVSPDVIYSFVKAWLENMDKFQTVHASLKEFGPDLIQLPSEMPYHEGAIKALKEKGLWTAEMDKVHQARLKQATS